MKHVPIIGALVQRKSYGQLGIVTRHEPPNSSRAYPGEKTGTTIYVWWCGTWWCGTTWTMDWAFDDYWEVLP